MGAILRDSHGEFVVAFSKIWNGLFSRCEIEALSLKEVLNRLKAQQLPRVFMEMDALQVVQSVLKGENNITVVTRLQRCSFLCQSISVVICEETSKWSCTCLN